jgi:hypothetical protein
MKKIIAAIKTIIRRFHYESLRNETHVSFHEDFNAIVAKYNPETLGIAVPYAVYTPLFTEEKAALDQIIKSQYTAQIDEMDRQRDSPIRGFTDTVTAALHHFDPDKRQAARRLHDILDRYGNIAHKTLHDETAAIEDLHTELIKQENYLAVAALGLGEWLGTLVQVNRNLAALMLTRIDETAKRPDLHMRGIRKEVDREFRSILDLLEALIRVNGADTNKAFIAELNALSEKYKDLLAQEAGRRHPIKDLGAGDHTVIEPVETQQYTGRPITIIPEVHYREEGKETKRLYLGEDFTITYKNNVEVGQAELTIHGKGDYKGEKSLSFHIAR